ncbi:MAG: outer membrane protein assembly factor BamD [Phycisphaerae bacterium]
MAIIVAPAVLLSLVMASSLCAVTIVPRPTPSWLLQNGVWIPLVAPNPNTPEGQVAEMISELNSGHLKKIPKQAKHWIKVNKTNPLAPEVLLLRGDAYNAMGAKYTALFSYEDLLDNYPTSPLYGPCLRREYNIACAFLRGYKRKFLGMRILPVNGDALELLRRIQDRQRGSPLAELAGIRVADYYYSDARFHRAFESYQDFLRRYPYSQFVVKATLMEVQCLLATFRGVKFDLTPLRNADAELESLTQNYPHFAQMMQVRALEERIYQIEGRKELEIARFYIRFDKPAAARYYYNRVINDWPDTPWAKTAKKELQEHFGSEALK